MAVVLGLQDIYSFNEKHPNVKDTCDIQTAPLQHFNMLFCSIFGLHKLPYGENPHDIVDVLRGFLQVASHDGGWYMCRIKKYLWALRRRQLFLHHAVVERRRRLHEALLQWEAHDKQLECELQNQQHEKASDSHR